MKVQLIVSTDSREQIILIGETEIEKKILKGLEDKTTFELTSSTQAFTERRGSFMMSNEKENAIALRPLPKGEPTMQQTDNLTALKVNYFDTHKSGSGHMKLLEKVIERINDLGFVIVKR